MSLHDICQMEKSKLVYCYMWLIAAAAVIVASFVIPLDSIFQNGVWHWLRWSPALVILWHGIKIVVFHTKRFQFRRVFGFTPLWPKQRGITRALQPKVDEIFLNKAAHCKFKQEFHEMLKNTAWLRQDTATNILDCGKIAHDSAEEKLAQAEKEMGSAKAHYDKISRLARAFNFYGGTLDENIWKLKGALAAVNANN